VLRTRASRDVGVSEIAPAQPIATLDPLLFLPALILAAARPWSCARCHLNQVGNLVGEGWGGPYGREFACAPSSLSSIVPTTHTQLAVLIGQPSTCIPESTLTGSVIGEVEPVTIMDTTGGVIFGVKGAAKDKQTIQKLEGGVNDTLKAFGMTTGFESTDSFTFEEPIEVT
jgi:hypothetical protein